MSSARHLRKMGTWRIWGQCGLLPRGCSGMGAAGSAHFGDGVGGHVKSIGLGRCEPSAWSARQLSGRRLPRLRVRGSARPKDHIVAGWFDDSSQFKVQRRRDRP